jgi:hypothetical protein
MTRRCKVEVVMAVWAQITLTMTRITMAEDDKAHGFDQYTHNDGAQYEGYWVDDKQHG